MSDTDPITGTEDIITENEIKRRVWYIEYWDCGEDLPDCGDDDCPRHGSTAEELRELRELQSEVDSGSYATLISEGSFASYVQSERESVGGIPADLADYIDWESYAEDQEREYSSVTFRGATYYTQ